MAYALADEVLYTDYTYSDKTVPCSIKFKTNRIDAWIDSFSKRYNLSPTSKPDDVLEFRIDSPCKVVLLCHKTTGVVLVQGSDFFRWTDLEYFDLKSSVQGNKTSNVQDLILKNNGHVWPTSPNLLTR